MALSEDELRFLFTIEPRVEPSTLAKVAGQINAAVTKGGQGVLGGTVGGLKLGAKVALGGAAVAGGAALGVYAGSHVAGAAGGVAGKAMAGSLGLVNNALAGLQGELGPITSGLGLMTSAFSGLGKVIYAIPVVGAVLGPLSDALTALPGLFGDILGTLVGFAAKASPGIFHTWQRALLDVQGVIGQSFLPVLELMREGVRLFGDVLANVLPSFGEARAAMAPAFAAFAELGGKVREVLAQIGPSIRELLVKGIQQLAHWFAVAAKAMQVFIERFKVFVAGLGIKPAKAEAARSSVGAAAAPAAIQSIQSYSEQLITSALSQGQSLPQQQVDALNALNLTQSEVASLVSRVDATISTISSILTTGFNTLSTSLPTIISVLQGIAATVEAIANGPKAVVTAKEAVQQMVNEKQRQVDLNQKLGLPPSTGRRERWEAIRSIWGG